jgi:hypothetical protein
MDGGMFAIIIVNFLHGKYLLYSKVSRGGGEGYYIANIPGGNVYYIVNIPGEGLSFVAKWRAGTNAIIAMKNSIDSKTYSTTSLRNIMQKHLRLRS